METTVMVKDRRVIIRSTNLKVNSNLIQNTQVRSSRLSTGQLLPNLAAGWADVDLEIWATACPTLSSERIIATNINVDCVGGTTATSLIGRNIGLAVIIRRLRGAAVG
jgi:hypothetical protein